MEEMVEITKKEYEDLLDTQKWAISMQAAGVDNWSGFSDAMEYYEEIK